MNAVSHPAPNFAQEHYGGSDSDSNLEESPEYYQPISTEGDDHEEEFSDDNADNDDSYRHRLPNGNAYRVENGVSSLDLSDKEEEEESSEEEEERVREASDSAIRRAFREDERRRNAPLPAENAVRVMEAMRGISFGGIAPEWAGRVPEDQWIDQLTRLRSPPGSATPSAIQ